MQKLSVTVPNKTALTVCIRVAQNYFYCHERGCFTKEWDTAGGSPTTAAAAAAAAIISSEQDI